MDIIGYKIWQLTLLFAIFGGGMETIVDKFGRIVIPKKIRNEHNIEPGTQLRIEEKDDVIILIPVRGEHNLQSKDGVLVYTGVAMGDIGEAVSKHREKRARTVGKLK
jgi:AbrB family looped-hinge helix DNA binding protein